MMSDVTLKANKRPVAFWIIILFMALSVVLLVMGQTMAVFNYPFAVSLGLQEDVKEISEFGVQLNRAFGASDSLIYIPLIVVSIFGLSKKKKWGLYTSAAVMGISSYWATTAAFIFWFLVGVPDYSFVPGVEYWFVISLYIVFGLWGVCYLILRGDSLIS